MFEGFSSDEIRTDDTTIWVRISGSGPPVLLLHGFPETHLMWRDVGPQLARSFTVVCADLRGYGRSGCPPSATDHSPYSKRTMAHEMVLVMERLGFSTFSVAGHDRGARVAYRMAIDYPNRVTRAAMLDIVPTGIAWERADAKFSLAFWPWSLLAQAEPLPERILTAVPDAIIGEALDRWGSPPTVFPSDVRTAYVESLRDPRHAHAICEEYRAAAEIDREHDRSDRDHGRRITCPLLVLWSDRGPLATWCVDDSGPLALWRSCAVDVRGHPVEGGHFFPEEAPGETARGLDRFFDSTGDERDAVAFCDPGWCRLRGILA